MHKRADVQVATTEWWPMSFIMESDSGHPCQGLHCATASVQVRQAYGYSYCTAFNVQQLGQSSKKSKNGEHLLQTHIQFSVPSSCRIQMENGTKMRLKALLQCSPPKPYSVKFQRFNCTEGLLQYSGPRGSCTCYKFNQH